MVNNYSKKEILDAIDFFNENTEKVRKLIYSEYGQEHYSALSDYYTNINLAMRFLYDLKSDNSMLSENTIARTPKKYYDLYNELTMYKNGYFHVGTFNIDDISYMELLVSVIKERLTDLGLNLETGRLFSHEVPKFNELDKTNPIYKYVSTNPMLMLINKQRRRNVTIFDNMSHEVIYDLYSKTVYLKPKIPFSDIEHDTNRKFTEDVILNILFNFNNKKNHYLKLLSNKPRKYKTQIDIIKGKKLPTDDEILILISLLGRLEQENRMGPITVRRKEKLNPELILKHNTNLDYIRETIRTFNDYQNTISSNIDSIKLIPNYNFDIMSENVVDNQLLLPLIQEVPRKSKTKISTNKIKGTVESPNYLLSFFGKFVKYNEFKDFIPLYNSNETLAELIEYSKRFKGNPEKQDFVISAKTRTILKTANPKQIFNAILEVEKNSRRNTYSKKVSNHILSKENKELKELLRLFIIFENSVQAEKARYKAKVDKYIVSEFNDSYISIASDMHLSNLEIFEKSNFSRNFNIIAGDFVDNLFHRGGVELEGVIDISGVGVLGNHDVLLKNRPTQDLKEEVKNNYSESIKTLSKIFPNIRILNDEIKYKDGYALVGLTLFYDIVDGNKTFFANKGWGKLFDKDDYIKRTKSLLDKVDKKIPIIFISHTPFKEYSVATNKDIGVPSNFIFRDYPNVKMYIHGHGHSSNEPKIVENVLCLSNPIVMQRSISEKSFSKTFIKKTLGIKDKVKITTKTNY